MSFHVKDDFKAGAPISQVPASWFNSVAKFLNGLVGGFGVKTDKHESGRSTVSLDKQVLQQEIDNVLDGLKVSKKMGDNPKDHTDVNAPDVGTSNYDATAPSEWIWRSGGSDGLKLDVYCRIRKPSASSTYRYFGRCTLEFSKDGLLVKATGLANEVLVTSTSGNGS